MTWQAHLAEEWQRDGWLLHLVADAAPGQVRYLTDRGEFDLTGELDQRPGNAGLYLPDGAWQAILALAAPMATAGELDRLQDALTVERARVDRALERNARLVFVKGDGLVPYTAEGEPR